MYALERRIGQRRGATRAPTQAPEWQGRLRAAPEKSDPLVRNLLRPKNGLDNGVHLKSLNISIYSIQNFVEILIGLSQPAGLK